MPANVTLSADAAGAPLEALARLIERRVSDLGELVDDAVVASGITVLKSLRAATRVADPKKAGGVIVGVAGNLEVSGYWQGGKRHWCARPVGGGHHIRAMVVPRGLKVTTACTVFHVRDMNSGNTGQMRAGHANERKRYYVISDSIQHAKEYAREVHARRVARYAGMAQWLLGAAMGELSTRAPVNRKVEGVAVGVARLNMIVKHQKSGFNSGSSSIEFKDSLRYAMPALKAGETSLVNAMKSAANSIAGRINAANAKACGADRSSPFAGKIPTPFPDVKRRK